MSEMNIREQWNRLDPATQHWLIDNPGCMILPRTVTATINAETGEGDDGDQHGEMSLSPEDREFIQARAMEAASAPSAAPPYRFFDATQP